MDEQATDHKEPALIEGVTPAQRTADTNPLAERNYRFELHRKAIHFCSISIPVIYFYTPRSFALSILIPLTIAFLVVDVARYYSRPVEAWFYKWFGMLLRKHESNRDRKTLNGATYVLIAATLCVVIFPKIIAVTSFIILILADMAAALIGTRFGRHRFFNKSLEGSLGFFVAALLVVLATPKISYTMVEYLIGIVAAAIGTIVEALPIEIDDNLSIPMSVGFAMWGMYVLLAPSLNIYAFG